ncbi:hypothetical protein IIB79_00865 [candidate division KSB1 bacterium]|nr:hypothetical protein [candidate division KSB1 bacterium]
MNNRSKLLIIQLAVLIAVFTSQAVIAQAVPEISPKEFSRLSISLSENSGYFNSDNWVSNEISYLDVLDVIDENDIEGGVYIGVGANQNFTYIANIKPDMAFIVDIRKQNRMQHLIYKILFEISETPAAFISKVISKPLDTETGPKAGAPINAIVDYFYTVMPDEKLTRKTEKKIFELLDEKYEYNLSESEQSAISYVLNSFRLYGLGITYNGYRRSWYPTWGQLLKMSHNGEQLNPFNSMDDYRYLRKMYVENRIIPVTGNFAGSKTLRGISEYMREHNLTVTAYYVSNVEQYLFRNLNDWANWVRNVKILPLDDKSVFIRWIYEQGYSGYHETKLQWMNTFIKNYNEGRYYSYNDVKHLDYIIK